MRTIFESLRDDHGLQRELIKKLVATTGDSPERAELFEQLKTELEIHARHEERQFYVPLMQHDLTQEKARHSVSEHKELDDLVEKLQEYDRTAPQWLVTAKELEHELVHHLDEEEQEVFQLAGKALTETQKAELAKAYEEGMNQDRE